MDRGHPINDTSSSNCVTNSAHNLVISYIISYIITYNQILTWQHHDFWLKNQTKKHRSRRSRQLQSNRRVIVHFRYMCFDIKHVNLSKVRHNHMIQLTKIDKNSKYVSSTKDRIFSIVLWFCWLWFLIPHVFELLVSQAQVDWI